MAENVTIVTVARRAQVSRQTVSNVLNGGRKVSDLRRQLTLGAGTRWETRLSSSTEPTVFPAMSFKSILAMAYLRS